MTDAATPEELAAGRGYESLFVPALFGVWAPHVVEAAGVAPGDRVLDVACGTGVAARAALRAAGEGGGVVGLDAAAGMLAAAAETEASIEWVQGTAEALPFESGAFDVVLSQFGMMFFPDRRGAAAEMARVLRQGGRLAIAVWDGLDGNPAYADISSLVGEEVGRQAAEAIRMPFTMGDADAFGSLVAGAGFEAVSIATLSERARFPSPRTMVEVELRGWLPLFGIVLDEGRIGEILAVADERLAGYATAEGAAEFSTRAHLLSARRPGG